MAAIVVTTPSKREWATPCSSCCAAPGGCGNCCYVFLCGSCAAGDVAKAAGRDYCMSCCVIPFFAGCIMPCWFANDRQALATKYNIQDPYGYCTTVCMFCLGCGTCLLAQELNTIKAYGEPAPQANVVILSPVQQGMGAAPPRV